MKEYKDIMIDEEVILEYYVLFPNHNSGLQLHRILKDLKIKCTIVPTPRRASTCCGISLLIPRESVEYIKSIIEKEHIQILDIVALPKITNAMRDKFC